MSKFKPYYTMSKSAADEFETLKVKKIKDNHYEVISDGEVIFEIDYDNNINDYVVTSYGDKVGAKQTTRVLTHPVVMRALGLE